MVFINYLKCVRIKGSYFREEDEMPLGVLFFFFFQMPASLACCSHRLAMWAGRELQYCFNWSADEIPAIQHKQLSSVTPEMNDYCCVQHSKYLSLPCFTLPALPCPFNHFLKGLRPMEIWAVRDLRGHPSNPPAPTWPVLRVASVWGTDLRLCETNACCSPCSLLCPYSAMATYSATCANNSPAQGINMANSIANLRLKAKEYSLQRNQVPTVNWGKKNN